MIPKLRNMAVYRGLRSRFFSTFATPPSITNPLPALAHQSVLSTVGKTPLIKLSSRTVPRQDVSVFVKCEFFNPMGSIKDRLAIGALDWAERHGQISPGQTVVECTSGNSGIALAMACAAKGYPFVAVMSESFSIERRKLMRFLGAKVVLTNPAHKGSGMLIKVTELAEEHGWFCPQQFHTEANSWIHFHTTGPELVEALQREQLSLDYWFCSYGTGGTFHGVSKYLRASSPDTKIHVCEPENAPLLYSGVGSEFNANGTVTEAHPLWRPHLLQGWTPDFIPSIVGKAVEDGYVDALAHVSGPAAMEMARTLAQKEGILTGPSGGGNVSSAVAFAMDEDACPAGSTVVAMVADTGERYLSTPLFSDISADMNEEEQAIAASTPSKAPLGASLPAPTQEAQEFVQDRISRLPVVVWSLESCEFCWTAVSLLNAIGLQGKFEVINIDAFEYVQGNLGNQFRKVLQDTTGQSTFPQIFVGGEFIGGAVDACLKWNSGELQPLLKEKAALDVNDYNGNPFEFLPKWMSQNPLRSS